MTQHIYSAAIFLMTSFQVKYICSDNFKNCRNSTKNSFGIKTILTELRIYYVEHNESQL